MKSSHEGAKGTKIHEEEQGGKKDFRVPSCSLRLRIYQFFPSQGTVIVCCCSNRSANHILITA